MSTRLNKEDWLDFGLKALSKDGPEVLKANILAKALGVTRGSFYWHFEDLEAFHTALIEHWRIQTSDAVIAQLPKASAAERLQALLAAAAQSDDSLERAMRRWPKVQSVLALSDAARVAHIAQLLQDCGLDEKNAQARAQFLYWANIGRIMTNMPVGTLSQDALSGILKSLMR